MVQQQSNWVAVPWQNLDPETLTRLLAEIVSRDGTDYGEHGVDVEQRINQARRALQNGAGVLVFDEATAACQLIPREQMPHE